MKLISLQVALFGAALALAGCSKEYVRGSNDPSIDNPAMSTGLDKEDIQRMLSESLGKLRNAPLMELWRGNRGKDIVAIFPYQNATSEHIDSQLGAALSETETWLVESGVVTVISRERQKEMIAEVEGHQNPVFNPANVTKYGRQLGAKYFITGKVQAAAERTDDARRVQYFLFMQVIEVETSAIRFQHKAYITKMVR
ncbi:MAG: penicillin-binding protein activator LpoB [Myxococcales bacterium]|nr:penicillin-binding protein activator LpoB [Myxococcales bacterium]